ncbi:MAG TPA: GspMb/PilO family protein [Candidatus Acidoferrales bacterium]|nr:GspMb/PilO family protein [Candidatus Acidoferrales bacterium]
MTMKGSWQTWKAILGGALALVLLADLGLVAFLWQSSRQEPQAMRGQRDLLAVRAKLLRNDVDRGEKIRASLPQAGKECDDFYRDTFLDTATGYSRIEADLDVIARQSGVKTSGFSFKQSDVKGRGVTEISISTNVDADYPSVIRFINGLERSKNFYLLDSLHLASATTGGIRLDLELHTYFRT